jgi:hypothetical protein
VAGWTSATHKGESSEQVAVIISIIEGNWMKRLRKHEERDRGTSFFGGYKVTEQETSASIGRRPDFFGVSKKDPGKRIVGDAKYVRELTPQHVKQVRQYKGYPFFAQKGVIVVKKSTRVPDEVREMARNSDIKIVRMQARREKKKSLLERPFGF